MTIRKLSSVVLSVVAAHLLWSGSADAMIISDTQTIQETLSNGETYTGAFNPRDSGVPGATVQAASAYFTFFNFDGAPETVTAVLGSGDWFAVGSSSTP